MQIKLVVSDIDGTLINEERKVAPATKAIIQQLPALGIHFMLATGRSYEGALKIAQQLELDPSDYGIIALNGLHTYQDSQTLWRTETNFSYEDCLKLEAIGRQYYVGVLYCFDDKVYLQMDERTYADYTIALNPDQLRYFKEDTSANTIRNLSEIKARFEPNNQLLKVVYLQSADYLDLVIGRIKHDFPPDFDCLLVGRGWAEIMPSRINKGQALKNYAQAFGYNLAEAVAFGDAENDIEMFKAVKLPIAMENALENVKEHAVQVTGSNQADGLAQALNQLLNSTK